MRPFDETVIELIRQKEKIQDGMEEDMIMRIKENPLKDPNLVRIEFLRNQCAAMMLNIAQLMEVVRKLEK